MTVCLSLLLLFLPWVQSTDTDGVLERFNAWFASIDRVGLMRAAPSPQYGGAGVVPVQSGRQGDTVLRVPLQWAMHRASLSQTGVELLDRVAASDECDESDLIAVALIVVKKRLAPSLAHWAAWVDAMPVSFLAPFHVSDAAVLALFDAATRDAVQKQRADALLHWSVVERLGLGGGVATFDEWLWALGMVNSRAMSLRGTRYLVPMADMFNFAPTAAQLTREHSYETRGDDFAATHKVVGDEMQILADRDFVAGAELFETYGDNPDSIYLQFHGFVPDVNPSACVDLRIDLPMLRQPSASSPKWQILQRLRVPRFRSYCARDKRFTPLDASQTFPAFPSWLIDIVNVDRLSDAQASALLTEMRFAWRAPAMAESSAKLVQTVIHRWAVAARDAYSSTLAQDEAALAGALTPAERLARLYVRNQKRILQQWIIADPPEVAAYKARQEAKKKTEL